MFRALVWNRYKTYVLMTRWERKQGWLFDYVVWARPDLVWSAPLAPWCLLPFGNENHIHGLSESESGEKEN